MAINLALKIKSFDIYVEISLIAEYVPTLTEILHCPTPNI